MTALALPGAYDLFLDHAGATFARTSPGKTQSSHRLPPGIDGLRRHVGEGQNPLVTLFRFRMLVAATPGSWRAAKGRQQRTTRALPALGFGEQGCNLTGARWRVRLR
mgnify:CR=1 FL=1